MGFNLTKEQRDFVKNIVNTGGSHGSEDKGKFMFFDPYYCFALIGLSACEIDNGETDAEDFVQTYPLQYKEKRDLIAGLLISTEAKRTGIETNNPKLESVMMEYLSGDNPTLLTDAGMKKLNAYSRRGFILYQEVFPDPPQSREEFLQCFGKVLMMYER